MEETNRQYPQTPLQEKPAPSNGEDVIDLMEIGYLLWNHILMILLCLVIGAAGAFAYTKFCITKQYTATTSMYIVGDTDSLVDLSSLQIGSQIKGDYQELIKSEDVMQEIIDGLALDETYESFISKVTITNPSDTHVIKISVRDPDQQMAADIANKIASVAKKKLPEIMKISAPEIYNKAKAPEKASSPSTMKNTALGGLVVAMIYCAYLIINFLMNDTFVTPEDINKVFGVQPIAVVPMITKKRSKAKKGGKRA